MELNGIDFDIVMRNALFGSSKDQKLLSDFFLSRNDYENAARFLGHSSDNGDSESHNHLGLLYAHGLGVPQNYEEAVNLFRRSANQGNMHGQNSLGTMYANGYGVPKIYHEAFIWFTNSANKGYCVAQNNLGTMYAKGWGVQQDYAKAAEWYGKAANQGFTPAKKALERIEELMQSNSQSSHRESARPDSRVRCPS